MTKANEYRLRAERYLELAHEAEELYARETLSELAEEFIRAAERLERRPVGPLREH